MTIEPRIRDTLVLGIKELFSLKELCFASIPVFVFLLPFVHA